jgi:hypothetical protein
MNRQLFLTAATPICAADRVFDNRQSFFAGGAFVFAAPRQ